MSAWTPPDPAEEPAEAARAWYLRIASGEASISEVAALRQWLAEDAAHQAAFDRARALWQGVGALVPPEAAARRRPAIGIVRRPRMAGAFVATAALLLFLAMPPVGWFMADHRTGAGEIARLTLPDGTLAMLDTESAIDVDYSAGERRVTVRQGQAWFDVAEAQGAFVVVAGEARVTDIGTAFAVRRMEADGLRVDVDEGIVDVAWQGGTLRLRAGERGRFTVESERREALGADTAGAWRSGRLIFEGRPLGEVLDEIDRYRQGRILLLDNAAAVEPVTAILALEHLDGGLEALARTERLTLTEITPWLTLVRTSPR